MRFLTLIAIVLFYTTSSAQTFEIGPYVGGANYIGDIGKTTYVNPNTLLYGVIFKWNRSRRHSFRLSVLHTNIKADDAKASEGLRKQRGLSFETSLTEVSLGIEFTFWEFNLHKYERQFSPYLYTGVNVIHMNYPDYKSPSTTSGTSVQVKEKIGRFNFSIPFIVGAKADISDHLVLAAEIGPRYVFGDLLDGKRTGETAVDSYSNGDDGDASLNPNTNDWYMFAGVTLTYTFGRTPCDCNF